MSTASAPAVSAVRFGHRSSRGVLLGLSGWRLLALGLATGIFVASMLAAGGVGAAVGLVLAAPLVAVAYATVGGRPAVEWTPVVADWSLRRLCGQTTFRARPMAPRPAGTLALPGDAAALRFHVDGESGACMIHDPHRQTLAAVLAVTHPAYVLLGPDSRASRVGAWGRVLAGLAHAGTCAAVQVLEATIPEGGQAIADYYAAYRVGTEGWAVEQYEALLAANQAGASTHRTTITLSLDMRAAARDIRVAGGGLGGAAKILRGDMAALEWGLRAADLHLVGWLGEAALAQIVRCAYDPAAAGQLTADAPGANLAHAGPLAVNESWGHLRHDSGYSAVLWISEWPRIEVQAHFLHALIFTPGVRKTFSLVAKPLGTREALRQIRHDKTELLADAHQKAKIGQIADLSDGAEYDDVLARERALISGHAEVCFTGWVAVTASSPDDLAAAVKQVERAAIHAGCETRVLYGQQSQAFTVAALPLGRTTL